MSDEIVDVKSEVVLELTNRDVPEEKMTKSGENIPDPSFIDDPSEEGLKEIEERRQELGNIIPPYPTEWQQDYKDEESKGFDDSVEPTGKITLKQQEINKIIKKYKRYLRSNLSEIRRVGNENNEG